MGRPRSRAMILASPIAAPPPAATRPSALAAAARPASATALGTCTTARACSPAERAPRISTSRAPPQPRPPSGGGDSQRTLHAEAARFVGNTHGSARCEHDALGSNLVNEGCAHSLLRREREPGPKRLWPHKPIA